MLYNNLSSYLKSKYGTRMKKICIDGGFTCPNRDGTVGVGGCIYCSERGSGEHIEPHLSITEQVTSALCRAGESDSFIAYFQNFTNTYEKPEELRRRYDAALIDDRIKILAIGTRPDCISDDVARLIASYRDRVDVWVELGLQSASDATAVTINRGYKTEVYTEACRVLNKYAIPIVTHVMIGLPGESERELRQTVALINRSGVWGVKLHSVYVPSGTKLSQMFKSGEYIPLSREEYVRLASQAIAMLAPDIVIHRITGDCPRELLVAPDWNTDKNGVINDIRKYSERMGYRQGSLEV